jgi:hypothetical protein
MRACTPRFPNFETDSEPAMQMKGMWPTDNATWNALLNDFALGLDGGSELPLPTSNLDDIHQWAFVVPYTSFTPSL